MLRFAGRLLAAAFVLGTAYFAGMHLGLPKAIPWPRRIESDQLHQYKMRLLLDFSEIQVALANRMRAGAGYPSTREGLSALVEEGYLDSFPRDPWGNAYEYLNPGQFGVYDIVSLGADGRDGGTGVDTDIGNWRLSPSPQLGRPYLPVAELPTRRVPNSGDAAMGLPDRDQ